MPSERTGKRIEKVAFLPKGQIKVSFEKEEFLLSKDVYTSHFLYEGKEVPFEEIASLKKEMAMDGLYRYGKGIASKGCYSSYEVLQKLEKKDPLHSGAVYSRLEKEGFFNDKELAKDYFEALLSKGYGEKRVKDTLLLKKRIAPEIVFSLRKEEVASLSPKDLLPLYEKKYKDLPFESKRRKVIDSLLRRGFDQNEINAALPYLEHPSKETALLSAQKDLASFERRYRKKYNGRELSDKLRIALHRRGHSKEIIKEVMEEKKDGLD